MLRPPTLRGQAPAWSRLLVLGPKELPEITSWAASQAAGSLLLDRLRETQPESLDPSAPPGLESNPPEIVACLAQGLANSSASRRCCALLAFTAGVAVRSPGTGIGGGGADTGLSRPAVQNSGELSTSGSGELSTSVGLLWKNLWVLRLFPTHGSLLQQYVRCKRETKLRRHPG